MLPTDILLEITTHLIYLESLYFDQSLIKNNPLIDILLLNNQIFCTKTSVGILFSKTSGIYIYSPDHQPSGCINLSI